ncbi:MAG: lytic transglycosylase domain-containing protein, partial [Alphaproteobacteria bacterium]|nr:lytic transglycosylase domain-containing protein [Alphaproteobacteria bacterium]
FGPGKTLEASLSFTPSLPATIGGMPVVLSNSDSALYNTAFKAQRTLDWAAADEALAQVSNTVIKGHVLAERYLNRKYEASAEELTVWLANYRTLPQAYDIYALAENKYGIQQPKVYKPTLISMRGDDNGLASSFGESKYYSVWKSGIIAYKAGQYAKAAEMFDKMLAARKELSPWKVSAAGFWSWRAHSNLGENQKAAGALIIAAGEPRSFYGILARKQLRQPLDVDDEDLSLSEEQVQNLSRYSAVIRSIALVQAGRGDIAERELRALYANLPEEDRYAVLSLSHQLSLPALQIALAKRLETKDKRYDVAKYPIPEWKPVGGFSVDPTLIYALVRQESGFRNGAISPAGAMGLMQLMPTTASMMSDKIGSYKMDEASDAERNITLGQSYVRHLLENKLVGNNMIYMLTAYNAGIGRLQEWKTAMQYRDDPLLFIETMPYAETRYYVMQVMTNYWLYNEILGVSSPTLASLATNQWPVYVGMV